MTASSYFADQFAHNQFLTGAIGGGLVAYVLAQARNVPSKVASFLMNQFTVHLTVHGEDKFGSLLDFYLSDHDWIKRSRKLGVHVKEPRYDHSINAYPPASYHLTAGPGRHIIRFRGHWLWMERIEEKAEGGGGDEFGAKLRLVTWNIRALGRSQKIFQDLVSACEEVDEKDQRIKIFTQSGRSHLSGEFEEAGRRVPRKMSTVFMDETLKQSVIEDFETFLKSGEWYTDHGVPYRRGYLLEGPPGTGKSTFIFALASILEKDIYIISPANVGSDAALMKLFNSAGDGIVVIEDLDAIRATAARKSAKAPEASGATPAPQAVGITLSGLLNAIDGISARDGRILIVTSNHPENLDPALLRPGRIDRRIHLPAIEDKDVARAMCRHFLGVERGDKFLVTIQDRLPLTPAVLQNILLQELGGLDEIHQPDEPSSPAG